MSEYEHISWNIKPENLIEYTQYNLHPLLKNSSKVASVIQTELKKALNCEKDIKIRNIIFSNNFISYVQCSDNDKNIDEIYGKELNDASNKLTNNDFLNLEQNSWNIDIKDFIKNVEQKAFSEGIKFIRLNDSDASMKNISIENQKMEILPIHISSFPNIKYDSPKYFSNKISEFNLV